jgi:hypothetical protein
MPNAKEMLRDIAFLPIEYESDKEDEDDEDEY